jgi:hypothetical protein
MDLFQKDFLFSASDVFTSLQGIVFTLLANKSLFCKVVVGTSISLYLHIDAIILSQWIVSDIVEIETNSRMMSVFMFAMSSIDCFANAFVRVALGLSMCIK